MQLTKTRATTRRARTRRTRTVSSLKPGVSLHVMNLTPNYLSLFENFVTFSGKN